MNLSSIQSWDCPGWLDYLIIPLTYAVFACYCVGWGVRGLIVYSGVVVLRVLVK